MKFSIMQQTALSTATPFKKCNFIQVTLLSMSSNGLGKKTDSHTITPWYRGRPDALLYKAYCRLQYSITLG